MILGGIEMLVAAVIVEPLDRGFVDLVRGGLMAFPVMAVVMTLIIVVVIVTEGERVLGLGAEQRLAILLGDLVIIRVDFREGQEAVAIAAELDERRLERRLHARHLGKIDIALELLAFGGFEIELFDPVTLYDRDPGLFRVARVDQHARRHYIFSGRAVRCSQATGAPISWSV